MNIAGLDVSRNWAIVCILSSFPEQLPSQLIFKGLTTVKDWNQVNCSRLINGYMYRLEANQSEINLLQSLDVGSRMLG